MKTFAALLFVALAAVRTFAADQVPLFNAMLTVGKEHRFVLINAAGKTSSFLRLGESFDGYTVKSFDVKSSELELERGGKSVRVGLVAEAATASAAMPGTRATVAEAEALLKTMNFETMMDKILDGTKRGQTRMIDQMMGQFARSGADKDAIVALQKKMVDELMGALSGAELKDDVAKIYSEVFTKEELQGLANFYQTEVGQKLNEKTPEVTEKMNAIMMTRIMSAMPKVQAIGREFAEQQRAKRDAAAAAGANAPAPTPAPKS